ncbi:hypothetical protein A3Q56_06301 [Intoshia linei]|uniref:Dynein heavy chain 1, axonemal n=1 Tax=Intoshia linei TaxID=1819745 RepID=A0A177AVD7_9BILA|nr:hypothetical protein A3Q56_06301 [Intoshia linei]
MGRPGAGRNDITPRFLRHFNLIAFTDISVTSKRTIFNKITNWWLQISPKILSISASLVDALIEIHSKITSEMLPTPEKLHYTFNMRDLAKIIQGMTMFDASKHDNINDVYPLWYHESMRVYQDRLINDQDRKFFDEIFESVLFDKFEIKLDDIATNRPLLYGDMYEGTSDSRNYVQMTDHDKILAVVEESLEEFNVTNDIKLDLDIFMYAMEHLCRISRIIRQPFGNALLLGMGGSGRQSLTKLAAYMSDFEIFQINLSKVYGIQEWKEDLQKCMLRAGLQDKQIIFLFSDTQIKNESFLEDLSNILNSGDVPNLYGTDELDQIYTKMKPIALDSGVQPNTTNLFTIFKNRVRSNLHTVIAMSPMGETFRSRLLQFPALVNCCTIDWYSKWPKEALSSVAFKFLSDMEDWKFNNDETNNIVTLFQGIHTSIEDYSQKFLTELSRHNYVTPTSYLQLLNLFSKLKSSILNELTFSKNRTKIGLDKLLHTAKEVKFMQEELAAMKPLLYEAVQESIATMKQITQDTLVAEETKAVVQNEEDQADIQAKETQTIADSAQRDLSEALPALEEALVSLKSLNKNDVVEVRTMQRPPQVVVLVMEAVCIMKQVKPKKVASDKLGQKVDDYWEAGKALLQDPGRFLESLYKYDKENIPDSVISKITPYIMSESFQPSVIKHGSKACTSMCLWVRAMYKYNTVVKTVAPKREALKMAQESLAETQRILDDAKHRLQHIQEGIETLTAKYDECVKKKVDLENKTKLCQDRLVRADKLINGLADERIRWNESVVRLENKLKNILGDIILSAGFITYLGPFTGEYRKMILIDWIAMLKNYNIPYNTDYSFTSTMTDPIQIRNWQLFGLPKDSQSIENAVAVQHSPRWPLFIDPQSQANKWIKNMEKENDIGIIKFTDRDYMRTIENSIRFGKPCLFENVAEELDPAFDPILKKQIYSHSGSKVIKLADNIIPYHEDFKFYITSKNPNPHFSPELSIKVNVINFTISPSGLQDQLLGIVVAEERSDLEDAKNQLIISNSKMKQDLSNIEDKILQKLSQSEGNPVDDVDLIQTLASSKVKSAEIKFKVAASEKTELDIDQTRSLYIPVAVNTQILYFCVADLANIDPMYQYSLEWFIQIFINSIGFSKKSDDIYQRIKNINEYVTFSVYSNVCRSLFEIHKHLFSFMICTRIQLYNDEIDLMEWKFLINGMPYEGDYIENPHPTLISSKVWIDLHNLTVLPVFDGFINSFIKNFNDFKSLLSCSEPESEILTTEWENKLNPFQKMLLIKCLRLDRFTNCVQNYVCKFMGNQFIEPQTAQLDVLFKESSPTIPLVFVLSAGTDPAADLYNFAEKLRFSKKLSAISLGQGQGPRAEALMRSAMERGKWVFFQNCHLAPSWMPNLEKLIEQIDIDKVHRDFRLWLTSTATKDFPVTILQNSSKMTIEPPRGIKANLMRSYMSFTDEYLNSCLDKTTIFKPLLFSLCLFHGVLLERKKFGPLGYNIPYDFTYGDLKICLSQLNMFIMEYDAIPYTVLQYTAGEINYGGRVTDDWDRRLLMNQLFDFYSEKVLTDHHNYTENGIYYQINPSTSDLKSYLDYIKSLPNNDPAEIFGLHENAKISFAQNEAVLLFSYLQKLEPKIVSKQSGSREEGIYQSADKILAMIPPLFDISKIMQKYPILYEQSMNTVLNQEAIRYNNLLEIVKISLIGVKKALKGLIVLDRTLENVVNCIFSNKVPEMWDAKAYPSLKPLYPWITDLIDRIKFIQDWIDYNVPSTYWMSGFFFPQGFLTGTLQNFARREKISIDSISFEFQILDVNYTELKKSPKIGCYIRGLFLEGARWSPEEKCICESKPRILYTDMPVIWLLPKTNRIKPEDGYYECPVYKILTRAGTLNTTGISSNFVFSIEIPSKKPQKHWIQKAAALICALNY